jgi:diacylglycerol kinase (ATP)
VSRPIFAIVNPAAGGGRCGKLAGPALEQLRRAGVSLEAHETRSPGDGIQLARDAYRAGFRRFLAVGGDGTSYEIVNGILPQGLAGERPQLAFLPLGTGNSFLRDFTTRPGQHPTEALLAGHSRVCDVLRMTHKDGVLYYINLLSVGFAADVAFLRHARFQRYGELGYLMALFTCLARLERRPFPLRVNGNPDYDRRPCLFLSFNNSKFTGGKMMIAPDADPCDGLIEYVRWGPIGRLGLVANLHTLYTGTHIKHPLASRQAARQIEFELDAPVNVMVDGEVLKLQCQRLDVLPGALDVRV